MSTMDATKAISPAFNRMVKVLFQPFQLRKWIALGFIALFVSNGGGSSGGGNGNFGNTGHHGGGIPDISSWISHYWPFLVAGGLFLFGLSLLIGWIGSVFKFVFIDDIVRDSGAIKEPFSRLSGLGTSLFLWRLLFGLIALVLLAIFVGIPLVFAIATSHGSWDAPQVLAVVWAVMVGLSLLIIAGVIDALVRSFVTTTMYVRGVGILEAWRLTLPILKANFWQVVVYFLLTFLLGIAYGIAFLFVLFPVIFILLIPLGGIALVGYLIGEALKLTWTIPVIAIVSTYAIIAVSILAFALSCVGLPGPVFFQAYPLVLMGQADPSLATIPIEPTTSDTTTQAS